MKLSQAQLEQIAWGAVRVEETEQGVSFYRFTKEQTELYRYSNYDFYLRSMAPAGVRLVFRTDSGSMKLTAVSEAVSTRTFISFDVFCH